MYLLSHILKADGIYLILEGAESFKVLKVERKFKAMSSIGELRSKNKVIHDSSGKGGDYRAYD